jgi:Fe-S cluster assembly protein SufD
MIEATALDQKELFIGSLTDAEARPSLSALNALKELPLPTTRQELWKYTRTARLLSQPWQRASGKTAPVFEVPCGAKEIIRISNGKWESNESLCENSSILVERMDRVEGADYLSLFEAVNEAFPTDIIRITVKKGVCINDPIAIVYQQDENLCGALPVVVVEAQESSITTINEYHVSSLATATLQLRSLNVSVKEKANLTINKIHLLGDETFALQTERVSVASQSSFAINTITISGRWLRNDLRIDLEGEHAYAQLNGLFMPREKQFCDHHTLVRHLAPNCDSSELYKAVLNDQGIGVFNGKVYVQQHAQKTNAYQNNANILLSDDAQMNTKPELEIYADDVKCSHGTTTGQMDEAALFYLRSRGLSEDSARRLLIGAFAGEVIQKISHEQTRNHIVEELTKHGLLFHV